MDGAEREHPGTSTPPDASRESARSARPLVSNLAISLRPDQWTKNLIIFAGLLFSRRLFDLRAALDAAGAFFIFCALSGALYLLNDIADAERDRRHPVKARRPIAAGALPARIAGAAAVLLIAGALAGSLALGPWFVLVALIYVALLGAYSLTLKHLVILDVLTIAAGFVLRAIAGAVAIRVPISSWLLVCTTLLALFLALSKRRHELVLLADGATEHRRILEEYSPYLLDQMIAVVTASTLMGYAFYTMSADTIAKFHTSRLDLTIPFVLYGIFRYLYLVHRHELGGSPSSLLVNDRPLLACVALWALTVVLVIYHGG